MYYLQNHFYFALRGCKRGKVFSSVSLSYVWNIIIVGQSMWRTKTDIQYIFTYTYMYMYFAYCVSNGGQNVSVRCISSYSTCTRISVLPVVYLKLRLHLMYPRMHRDCTQHILGCIETTVYTSHPTCSCDCVDQSYRYMYIVCSCLGKEKRVLIYLCM